jgi:hypothetical protein
MDKVQKHNSFNTNTPSSESYKNNLFACLWSHRVGSEGKGTKAILIGDSLKWKLSPSFITWFSIRNSPLTDIVAYRMVLTRDRGFISLSEYGSFSAVFLSVAFQYWVDIFSPTPTPLWLGRHNLFCGKRGGIHEDNFSIKLEEPIDLRILSLRLFTQNYGLHRYVAHGSVSRASFVNMDVAL